MKREREERRENNCIIIGQFFLNIYLSLNSSNNTLAKNKKKKNADFNQSKVRSMCKRNKQQQQRKKNTVLE